MSLDNTQLTNAIFILVPYMETGGNAAVPYSATFSTGNSGLSYGLMQNDVANNASAKAIFLKILTQSGLDGPSVNAIVNTATRGVTRAQFSPSQIDEIDMALGSAQGQSLINSLDASQSGEVAGQVAALLDAASANPNGPGVLDANQPDPTALAIAAAWSNRTNGLAQVLSQISKGRHARRKDPLALSR